MILKYRFFTMLPLLRIHKRRRFRKIPGRRLVPAFVSVVLKHTACLFCCLHTSSSGPFILSLRLSLVYPIVGTALHQPSVPAYTEAFPLARPLHHSQQPPPRSPSTRSRENCHRCGLDVVGNSLGYVVKPLLSEKLRYAGSPFSWHALDNPVGRGIAGSHDSVRMASPL